MYIYTHHTDDTTTTTTTTTTNNNSNNNNELSLLDRSRRSFVVVCKLMLPEG